MLVLVLIPAIAAQDSSEAFFIEYSDESDEVIVEESDSIAEIEEVQNEVSVISEVEEDIEESYSDTPVQDQSFEIEENDDADIIISEQIDCSGVTHDIIEEVDDEQVSSVYYYENISKSLDDIDEMGEELTIKNISINYQVSVFNSKVDKFDNNIILIHNLYMETANNEIHCYKRSLIKFLELKNDLLVNQCIQVLSTDNLIDDEDIEIVTCADKITGDFVFSIDNSVIGDENAIIFVSASYCLNFIPCFDAFVCCNFFLDEYFFGGDFVTATGFFGNFLLEYEFSNKIAVEYIGNCLNLLDSFCKKI